MPSIRRSLIAYFLILLVAALGAVGVVVYRFSDSVAQSRDKAAAERIKQDYALRGQEAERSFNEQLERQAATLGREFRSRSAIFFSRGREVEQQAEYQLFKHKVAAVTGPTFIYLTNDPRDPRRGPGPWWEFRSSVRFTYWRNAFDEQVSQAYALESDDHPKYLQINFPQGSRRVIRPQSATYEMPPFPIDEYTRDQNFTARFDDVVINGEPVRRVVFKSGLVGGPRGQDPSRLIGLPALVGGHAPALSLLLYDRNNDPLPYIWIQVARPRETLESVHRRHAVEQQQAIDDLAVTTRAEMDQLRTQLLLIGLATLVILAAGGWFLVGRGIAPLSKLSEAVSQVSEKDFRLPVSTDELSHELVPIHDRLTHTLNALRRAFEREKQATADISHELRTPIASLLTTLEVALRKPRSAEQYRGTLEECREISKQLSRLVERIMTLAWLDAGNDRVNKFEVDAVEVAGGCATVIRPLAEAHGLTFTTDFDPDVRTVTDPDKLREVLLNLLHNAIEYNRPGGSVTLAVSRDNGHVRFEVRDTGIGMPPEIEGKIFERFFRADTSRTATGVHAGLGLAIVKEYVDRLGGSIAVETEPGLGTTFRVTMPAGVAEGRPVRAEAPVG